MDAAETKEIKPRLLIAEDERGPREVLEMILKPFFTLYSAETGKRVLEILEEVDVEMITIDLQMPGFRAAELLRAIRERRPNAELIIITGESGPRVQVLMEMFNISGYLLKPFDIEELLTVVNGTLHKKRPRTDSQPDSIETDKTASIPKNS